MLCFPPGAAGHLHSSHVALVQNSSSVCCGIGSYHGKWLSDKKKKEEENNSYNPRLQIQALLLFTFSPDFSSEFVLTAKLMCV